MSIMYNGNQVAGVPEVDFALDPSSQNPIANSAVASELAEAASNLDIVISGNKADQTASIGQYVTLQNSTISGRSDGLYKAAKTIPANTAIDSTYLTAVTAGGLNDLKAALLDKTAIAEMQVSDTTNQDGYILLENLSVNTRYIISCRFISMEAIPYARSNNTWGIRLLDISTRQPVVNTPVSGYVLIVRTDYLY